MRPSFDVLRNIIVLNIVCGMVLGGCVSEPGLHALPDPEAGFEVAPPPRSNSVSQHSGSIGWKPNDDPVLFSSDLEVHLALLPTEGSVEVAPWPGSYWPVYQDSINYKWDGPNSSSASSKYGEAFGVENVEGSVSAKHGIDSVYGTCDENADCKEAFGEICAKREGESAGKCIGTWWGICHAWAPVAIMEPEPIHPVVQNGTTFKVNDLKALMTLLYDRTDAQMLSSRCNTNSADGEMQFDEWGNPTGSDEACRDTNPGTLHVIMSNYLGLRGESFVEDKTFDFQVWNQPVRAYRVLNMEEVDAETANILAGATPSEDGRTAYLFNPDAVQLFHVETELDYISESGSNVDGNLASTVDDYTSTDQYEYILEVDVDGKIVGGEWVGGSKTNHPDFLWLPLERADREVAEGKIRYPLVKAMLDASISDNPGARQRKTVTLSGSVEEDDWVSFGPFPAGAGPIAAQMLGEGDGDLYIRMNESPNRYAYDCRPYVGGTKEECLFEDEGDIYVSVRGYQDADFEITLSFADGEGDSFSSSGSENDGIVHHRFAQLSKGQWAHFGPFEVGAAGMRAEISGTGDADLYVREGAEPTISEWDCRPYGSQSDEECVSESSGSYYISIRGYRASNISLTLWIHASDDTAIGEDILGSGDESLILEGSLTAGEWVHYGPFLPMDGAIRVVMEGTGDADLHIRAKDQPSASLWDCRPYSSTSSELCVLSGYDPVYISVYGYRASTYEIEIVFESDPANPEDSSNAVDVGEGNFLPEEAEGEITPSMNVEHLDIESNVDVGVMAVWTLELPPGYRVKIQTFADNDVDLYLQMNTEPTTSEHLMSACFLSGNESLEYLTSQGGTLHIGVFGYEASSFVLKTMEMP